VVSSVVLLVCAAAMVSIALVGASPAGRDELLLLSVLTGVPSAGLLSYGRYWPPVAFHPVLLATTVLISGAVVLGGPGTGRTVLSILYALPVLTAFVLFSRREATVHLVITAVAGVVSTSWSGGGSVVVALPATIVAAVMGLAAGWRPRSVADTGTGPTTDAENRIGFDRQLAECRPRVGADGSPLTVALIDFDSFAGVNEQVGRPTGDRMLHDVATAWRALLPDSARMARVGGDEFAIVFAEDSASEATRQVERLRRSMPHQHSFSAGVTTWEPGDPPALVMNKADALLSRAKRDGRNRTTHEQFRKPDANQLREAIGSGRLAPVFQPIIALGTGRMVGVEASPRWHPLRADDPPSSVPVAADDGMTREIGAWILERSCGYAAGWVDAGLIDTLTVKVGGPELRQPGYTDVVVDALHRGGLDPRHLILEIAGTAVDTDVPDVAPVVRALHGWGVRISIDDFGTGFSTLGRLNRLPVDVLKIDRSFIRDLPPDTAEAPLVTAIVTLGHALGLTLVADGIEHPHQRTVVAASGCDEGQGSLLGAPAPPERIPALARRVEVGSVSPG
jgi:diguanylate cyclase (GGDEF)-like protein